MPATRASRGRGREDDVDKASAARSKATPRSKTTSKGKASTKGQASTKETASTRRIDSTKGNASTKKKAPTNGSGIEGAASRIKPKSSASPLCKSSQATTLATMSSKAKGKQRSTDDTDCIEFEVSKPSSDPLLAKTPHGPFLNPFDQSTVRLSTLPRESIYYTTPRASRLPASRSFRRRLDDDVRGLLNDFARRCGEAGDDAASKTATTTPPPLELFMRLWTEQRWDLITLTWGEDTETRQGFFHATTGAFVRFLRSNERSDSNDRSDSSDKEDDSSSILRTCGALFALLLLHEMQPRPITPVPGLARKAFAWVGDDDDDDDDDDDPLVDVGVFKIPILASTFHSTLVTLPGRCRSVSPRLEQDVIFALRSLLGLRPESSHVGRSAFDILLIDDDDDEDNGARYEVCTLSEQQRASGQFGYITNNDGNGGTRLGLDRSEALLVRAAEALDVPLSTLFAERIQSLPGPNSSTDGSDATWIYIPGEQRATLFESKWIDRPLRKFDAGRLRKFTEPQVRLEDDDEGAEDDEEDASMDTPT